MAGHGSFSTKVGQDTAALHSPALDHAPDAVLDVSSREACRAKFSLCERYGCFKDRAEPTPAGRAVIAELAGLHAQHREALVETAPVGPRRGDGA